MRGLLCQEVDIKRVIDDLRLIPFGWGYFCFVRDMIDEESRIRCAHSCVMLRLSSAQISSASNNKIAISSQI